MDFLTHLYYSTMYPYRDRPDVGVRGRWNWCPPGAITIPYYHLFGSFLYDDETLDLDYDLGEAPRQNGKVYASPNPRYIGQNWCGSRELWERGVLYADRVPVARDLDGVPLCCITTIPPMGGAAINGHSPQGSESRYVAGGLKIGGPSPEVFYRSVAGGLKIGGPSPEVFYRSVAGGIDLGGLVTYKLIVPIAGGLLIGGDAIAYPKPTPAGGLLIGGNVTSRTVFPIDGGVRIGGDVAIIVPPPHPVGGLLIGGNEIHRDTAVVSGGLRIGGDMARSGWVTVSGGLLIGGSLSFPTVVSGGLAIGGGTIP